MEEQLIHSLYEIWSGGETSRLSRILHESYGLFRDPGDPWEGQVLDGAEYEGRLRYFRSAFPDLHFQLDHVIHANDLVSVLWRAFGTHVGVFYGQAPTGRKISFSGQSIFLIRNGRLAGHWQITDRWSVMEQLGALPPARRGD